MSEWNNCYELKNFIGESITKVQKKENISLFDLSLEIFGEKNKLIDVMDSFDLIWKLDNEIARRLIDDSESE